MGAEGCLGTHKISEAQKLFHKMCASTVPQFQNPPALPDCSMYKAGMYVLCRYVLRRK